MDITTALDRHIDQADSYASQRFEEDRRRESLSPRERRIEDLENEHGYLEREVRAIQRMYNITHEEWQSETNRCIKRLSEVAIELDSERMRLELDTIEKTLELHCAGMIKLHTRRIEIEALLPREVAR
jgi:GTPase SAR1 family protein